MATEAQESKRINDQTWAVLLGLEKGLSADYIL